MKRPNGFSLLEVMISMAILSISLLALFNFQSTSILSAARAQRLSTSTLLARQQMAEILLEIDEGILKGEFPEEKEDAGGFEDDKYADYSWKMKIRKVEIPAPPAVEGESDILSMVFSQISQQLSESSREVTLTISWKEFEEEQEGITLTTHVVKM